MMYRVGQDIYIYIYMFQQANRCQSIQARSNAIPVIIIAPFNRLQKLRTHTHIHTRTRASTHARTHTAHALTHTHTHTHTHTTHRRIFGRNYISYTFNIFFIRALMPERKAIPAGKLIIIIQTYAFTYCIKRIFLL